METKNRCIKKTEWLQRLDGPSALPFQTTYGEKNKAYLLTYLCIQLHFIIRTNIYIILHLAAVQPSPVSRLMAAWLGFLHIPDLHSQWPPKGLGPLRGRGD